MVWNYPASCGTTAVSEIETSTLETKYLASKMLASLIFNEHLNYSNCQKKSIVAGSSPVDGNYY